LCALLLCSSFKWQEVYPQLKFEAPIQMQQSSFEPQNFYIAERAGKIYRFAKNKATKKELILDISDKVTTVSEMGLLSFCFDPVIKNRIYLHYNPSVKKSSHISAFTISNSSSKTEASEKILLQLEQPYSNHNGGSLAFGPDKMLYISLGDGGSANDPFNNSQDLSTLLGKILRINPREKNIIPSDNPFVKSKDARAEIWAYGLRNVWRFSFDRKNGQLWAADVGQNRFEEVNIVTKGGNYGWRLKEGFKTHKGVNSKKLKLLDPHYIYGRKEGISITGGFVYRGKDLKSELDGHYIFADFYTAKVWSLNQKAKAKLMTKLAFIGSFAEDLEGELYALSLMQNKIYKLVK